MSAARTEPLMTCGRWLLHRPLLHKRLQLPKASTIRFDSGYKHYMHMDNMSNLCFLCGFQRCVDRELETIAPDVPMHAPSPTHTHPHSHASMHACTCMRMHMCSGIGNAPAIKHRWYTCTHTHTPHVFDQVHTHAWHTQAMQTTDTTPCQSHARASNYSMQVQPAHPCTHSHSLAPPLMHITLMRNALGSGPALLYVWVHARGGA
jgi:hypothetical protein